MKIEVTRRRFADNYTAGDMRVDGQHYCNTIEPHRIDWTREKKVKGKTAIPEGTYRIEIGVSKKFGQRMPYVMSVPQFSGVMIHPGNSFRDTAGCIIVGNEFVPGIVKNSREFFTALFRRIDYAIAKGETVTIEVK